jgi:hypothetical protein
MGPTLGIVDREAAIREGAPRVRALPLKRARLNQPSTVTNFTGDTPPGRQAPSLALRACGDRNDVAAAWRPAIRMRARPSTCTQVAFADNECHNQGNMQAALDPIGLRCARSP